MMLIIYTYNKNLKFFWLPLIVEAGFVFGSIKMVTLYSVLFFTQIESEWQDLTKCVRLIYKNE